MEVSWNRQGSKAAEHQHSVISTCLTAARYLLATSASPCSLCRCLSIMQSVLATGVHGSNANKKKWRYDLPDLFYCVSFVFLHEELLFGYL
jgi:hypothetical protein